MLESGLGTAFCLALGTLPNMKYPSDVFPSSRFYKENLALPDIDMAGPSVMAAPDSPGVGVEPAPEILRACTVERQALQS